MATFETPDQPKAVHHGHNIRRFREVKLWKQEKLAATLGPDWTQKKISILESTENIEADLLQQVAKALNVSTELLESFTEDSLHQYFNYIHDNGTANLNNSYHECTFNWPNKYFESVEKYEQSVEKIKELYEQLLKVEREKIALLERLLEKK